MKSALGTGFGVFIGTAIYTFAAHSPHRIDWLRACFVGFIAFLLSWAIFSLKQKKQANVSA